MNFTTSKKPFSNSHYETYFCASSALDTGNTKIIFLKARQRRAFKKTILIMRVPEAILLSENFLSKGL